MKVRFLVVVSLVALLMGSVVMINALPADGLPVLVYHEIGPVGPGDQEMFVAPEVFRSQLLYLKRRGYSPVTLSELHAHYSEGAELPKRPIVITFDDGYKGVYTNALPIMKEFGFVGVVFVTDFLNQQAYLTDNEVKLLLAEGFELGCHSRTHPSLVTKTDAELQDEVVTYKSELERLFDVNITSFAYPLGHYDDRVVAMVREGGYTLAFTAEEDLTTVNQGLLTLKRLPIFRFDSMRSFRRKLRRGK